VEYLVRGTDRIALHRYPDPGTGPVLVLLPAMGVPARYYRPFAEALYGQGFAVVAADLRGNGASTPRPGRASRYGYAELVGDIAAIRDLLCERDGVDHVDCAQGVPARPLLLAGHSLGGQLALLHAALTGGAGLAGLVLLTAAPPYWRDYPAPVRYGLLPYAQGIGAASTLLGVWPGWGFGGRQARRVMTDWAATARDGRFRPVDGVDPEPAIAELKTPVLAVSVEPDKFIPRAVVDSFVARLAAAPVEREHYTAEHLGAPVDHFKWVRASGPIAARTAEFAKR
jgi:predicted alpha/beta hydrolase